MSSEAQNPFNCPICLHVFKDPVTTSCGHNFCMKCINSSWDRDFQKGVFSCPICRKGFNQRPTLSRNTVLSELVEGMRNAPKAGPGDVACDVCTGQKLKAIKSCMVCLASYCQSHIQPHFKSEAFKKHNLVKPGLQQQICPQHHKALEIYCDDDHQCICVLCLGDNHRGHKTNSAAAQMVEKKKALKIRHMRIKQIAGDKKKKAKEFGRAVTYHKRSAQVAMKHIDRTFTELISSLQKRQAQVQETIRVHIKQEVAHAENRIQMLNKDIVNMQKEENTLESLLLTENYNEFFQLLMLRLSLGPCALHSIHQKICPTLQKTIQSYPQMNQMNLFETKDFI